MSTVLYLRLTFTHHHSPPPDMSCTSVKVTDVKQKKSCIFLSMFRFLVLIFTASLIKQFQGAISFSESGGKAKIIIPPEC